jgi:hypothetical protein
VRCRAYSVVLLGGIGGAADPLRCPMRFARQPGAEAICVAAVPEEDRLNWINRLLVELSHDLDLDVALNRTSEDGKEPPPFLAATRGAFARAHVANWTRTLVCRARASAAPEAPPGPARARATARGRLCPRHARRPAQACGGSAAAGNP